MCSLEDDYRTWECLSNQTVTWPVESGVSTPNVRQNWLTSHLNQAAIFHHCSFPRPSVPPCAQDLVIVIRCDGAGIPRVSLWLQFNLVSTPLVCPTALPFIVHPSTVVLCWEGKKKKTNISDPSRSASRLNSKAKITLEQTAYIVGMKSNECKCEDADSHCVVLIEGLIRNVRAKNVFSLIEILALILKLYHSSLCE